MALFFTALLATSALANRASSPQSLDQWEHRNQTDLIPTTEALKQAKASAEATSPAVPDASLDFLMQEAIPLSTPLKHSPSAERFDISRYTVPGHAGASVMLAENCVDIGDKEIGGSLCKIQYSNHASTEILRKQFTEAGESRQMVTIANFDDRKSLEEYCQIYSGTQTQDKNGVERKLLEFYEITSTSAADPSTREILIYDYDSETGKVRKMTWGQYVQDPLTSKEILISFTALTYDREGAPQKAVTESIVDLASEGSELNWDREKDFPAELNRELWQEWESWISNRPLQALLF